MGLKNLCFGLALAFFLAAADGARDITDPAKFMPAGYNLEERLVASGGLVECWNALCEIKSCSNEIVLFFLNGQADIGPDCCRAIDVITHNCWPAMLSSLGFTPEEGNILKGYCDGSAPTPAAPPAPK